jgi:hypothetical protein
VRDGEYLIRLLGRGTNHHLNVALPTLRAEILEGDDDGRRITLDLAPPLAARFGSAWQIERLARLGACFMIKVAVHGDDAGSRRNVVVDLHFLGFESRELDVIAA